MIGSKRDFSFASIQTSYLIMTLVQEIYFAKRSRARGRREEARLERGWDGKGDEREGEGEGWGFLINFLGYLSVCDCERIHNNYWLSYLCLSFRLSVNHL